MIALIKSICAISKTLVRVQFTTSVFDIPGYLDPDSYVFTGGLAATGVVVFQPDTVDVMTAPQETDCFYELEFCPDA